MTELIYQTDAYCKTFDAVVTGVDESLNAVTLSRTAFYPGGGGQQHDTGHLRAGGEVYPVVRVLKGNLHVIEGALPRLGADVQGTIDWETRYRLMRTHTGLHVLCGAVYRDYGALVTGGDMNPLHGRMDFEFERMQRDLVEAIEAAINVEVKAARPVEISILPREEAFQIPDLIRTKVNLLPPSMTHIRTVHIVGLDLQACGGTHLANTAEIGSLKIAEYKSKGGINKRIYLDILD